MTLRDHALRIAHQRDLDLNSVELDHGPITIDSTRFWRDQITRVIHNRFGGEYDTADCDHPTVGAWATALAANWATRPIPNPSLTIAGNTGSGKTRQALGALKRIVHDVAGTGSRVGWQVVSQLDLREDSIDGTLAAHMDAELLILDDLGVGKPTAWMDEVIERVVDRRWSRRAPTIYTTNLTKEGLRTRLGDRVYSRLGAATRVRLVDEDHRWSPR